MITVAELRELLNDYPDDMPIVVDGYQDGFQPLHDCNVGIITIEKRKISAMAHYGGVYIRRKTDVKVLLLSRYVYDPDEQDGE